MSRGRDNSVCFRLDEIQSLMVLGVKSSVRVLGGVGPSSTPGTIDSVARTFRILQKQVIIFRAYFTLA